MKEINEKQKELLRLSYLSLLLKKDPPLTVQYLQSVKPLITRGFIKPINFAIDEKVHLRFTITNSGINYLLKKGKTLNAK